MYSKDFLYFVGGTLLNVPVALFYRKTASYAPGIPAPDEFGSLSKIPQYGDSDSFPVFVVSEHDAERAGPHYDLRIGTEDSGLLSFATKKELPDKPGKSISVFQQPVHDYSYKDFSGEITSGYGKGYVHPAKQSPIVVHDVSDNKITFSLDIGKGTIRYSLVQDKQNPKRWHLVNISPNPKLLAKLQYKNVDERQARTLIKLLGQTISSVQPKVDGALGVVTIRNGKLEVFSHRVSKRTGLPIVHTERIFGTYPTIKDPNLDGAILLAEIYAVKREPNGTERILSPAEISSLLNAKFYNTLARTRAEDVQWRFYLFDVVRRNRSDKSYDRWYDVPYPERVSFLKQILGALPKNFHGPLEAKDTQSAEQLLETIKKHKHALTEEGIVLFPERGVPYKYKNYLEDNFYIVGFTPGKGKYAGNAIGGIIFSDKPGGDPIGVVGTGLDDALRAEIQQDPDAFIGRRIRVRYLSKLSTGKLRNPSFYGFAD